MIHKSVGVVRNLLKKRTQVVEYVKAIINADDVIIITQADNQLKVLGQTANDAMSVYMLGTAAGLGYPSAKRSDESVTVEDYMRQFHTVAVNRINRGT